MDAKHSPVDDAPEGQIIEHLHENMPAVRVTVFARNFIVETVRRGDLSAFVVTSEQSDAVWVFQLVAEQ